MIDIHSHIIPNVDDGSSSLEHSVSMLKLEVEAGVKEIICTPHYRLGLYTTKKDFIEQQFENLSVEAEKFGIKLYLGNEVYLKKTMTKEYFQSNCFSLAGSRYVLIEFDYNNFVDIAEIVYEFKYMGYIPIIAHIERYSYVKISDIEYFIESGALIQVNAESIVSKANKMYNKLAKTYLKKKLVHFVASDTHHSRIFYLGEAFEKVTKKFGADYADMLFNTNPRKVINNENI